MITKFFSSGIFIGPYFPTVEVFDIATLSNICNPPSIPETNLAPVLVKQDLGITVCGGSFTSKCLVLSPEGWVEGQPMNEVRANAASVQLGDKWMVSGKLYCYTVIKSAKSF